ncbi:MAG TPA: aminoglycoside phosphotransferase family protein [Anaerolineae bacterium]|nr:aminoglycoside phosphotransferase family protein [Anaerolineae bacterium]
MKTKQTRSLIETLDQFGLKPDDLIGQGGEANVYALDRQRVLRVYHEGTAQESILRRAKLLAELAQSATAVPFALPTVEETILDTPCLATIEPRLPGQAMMQAMKESDSNHREEMIRAYLDAASQVRHLAVPRPFYGDLGQNEPIQTDTFKGYLYERAAKNLAFAGESVAHVDARQIAEAWPAGSERSLVHLDFFPGNVLVAGGEVTAVIDFGTVSIIGDWRLDPLTAVAYLHPLITPPATPQDRLIADEWLTEQGLAPLYDIAEQWCAAFWSWVFAFDDGNLYQWCRQVLSVD